MREYRITKYNPKNRVNGVYSVHEWTSISDIGKTFDKGVLSYTQYKQVEQMYVDCCVMLINQAGITELSVRCLEYYDADIRFPEKLSGESDIRRIITYCLQEKCWAKLETQRFFIHFGYDYYMYIGTDLSYSVVERITQSNNLFCEIQPSPYSHQDSSTS